MTLVTGYFYMNMQTYLLTIYDIDFSRSRVLLNYVSLVIQFLLELFTTSFNIDSRRKHLRYVMLHSFKKSDSANDNADEIRTVYGNTITTIRN